MMCWLSINKRLIDPALWRYGRQYGIKLIRVVIRSRGDLSQRGHNFSFCNISCRFHFFLIFFRVFR